MGDEDLSALLETIREKRGYLLPHHGLMAVSMPEFLDAYDGLYTALTLTSRKLSRHDHEFVWMAILIATDEARATHHIPKFRDAGGSDEELASILALSALGKGCSAYRFVDAHWRPHLPSFDPRAHYLAAFRKNAEGSPLHLAHLAAAAVFTCMGDWQMLEWQICAAYEDGIDEIDLAEALSLTMFPGSVPYFVEAAGVWRDLVLSGRVKASPGFIAWARLSGQGGYDEAAGVSESPG
jgi:alkylhydroperoxidase/carboxymuconolactone decarboxylase family protein YurZ